MVTVNIKKGEGKTLTFTIKNRTTGVVINVTNATFTLTIKTSKTAVVNTILKSHTDFTTTNASDGIVTVMLTSTDTDIMAATYIGELKTSFSTSMLDKSADIEFVVEDSVA